SSCPPSCCSSSPRGASSRAGPSPAGKGDGGGGARIGGGNRGRGRRGAVARGGGRVGAVASGAPGGGAGAGGVASGTAFVRVNQLGYASGSQAKRAYLMSSGTETGATFSVKNAAGTVVYAAPIGANLGTWSRSYPDVYALDLSPVTAAGTY